MGKLFRLNLSFFIPYLVFLFLGLYLNLQFSQKEIFLFVNRYYTHWLDITMPIFTNVGDGIAFLILGLILSFVEVRLGLIALFSWLIEGVLVQVLKQFIFPNHERPWHALEGKAGIHMFDTSFHPYTNNSFPSGHSATAFCMFTLLALSGRNKRWSWVFFLLALTVAYSRIYLLQHYFIDTYAGSAIGVATAFIVYYYFYIRHRSQPGKTYWIDRPLYKLWA